jgi:hypothetical protein
MATVLRTRSSPRIDETDMSTWTIPRYRARDAAFK